MLLSLIITTPLLLAIAIALPAASDRRAASATANFAMRIAPLASALLIWPVFVPAETVLNWPLDGIGLRVDDISRPLLLLTGIAWTLAAWMAGSVIERRRHSFWLGWLLSLAGMNLVLLAADLIAFYFGYALLSLASFLLIVHHRDRAAWRAGRIYLILTLAGEGAVLAGVLLIAARMGNAQLSELALAGDTGLPAITGWLLLTGLAVKLGIVPLHAWLPLAHPEAPVPASAILSGVIVKAGLLGWLRLVPTDAPAMAAGGELLLLIGFATAFGGIALGLGQQRIKTVLAYSTVSQMGLVLVGFALGLQTPEMRHEIALVLVFFALHHGLNKTSLFMACGCSPGRSGWRMLLVALPALSLSAAPLTTGYVAKNLLKHHIHEPGLAAILTPVLALTSAATAVLMWKLLKLALAEKRSEGRALPAWIAVTLLALSVPWAWAVAHSMAAPPDLKGMWSATWPLLLAAAGILLWMRLSAARRLGWKVPEGDWIVGAERLAAWLPAHALSPSLPGMRRQSLLRLMHRAARSMTAVEGDLQRLAPTGLLMLLLAAGLWWLARAA